MKGIIIALVFVVSTNDLFATDLSVTDRAEIRYRAELLVNEFQGLLNVITNEDITLAETHTLIENSYSNSINRIFFDSEAIIEDDIDPRHTSYEKAKDVTIEKYLNDLDLLYKKSPDPSISFSNIKVSAVQDESYIYARAYFESKFNNEHKGVKTPYETTKRVAEIRADKKSGKWQTYIVSIVFYNPEKPLTESTVTAETTVNAEQPENTTEPKEKWDVKDMEATIDSLVKIRTAELFDQYQSQQESAYEDIIRKADIAFRNKDYFDAIERYVEAKKHSPYEIYPKNQLKEIYGILKVDEFTMEKDLFEEAVEKGNRAYAMRDYATARNYFKAALTDDPGNADLKKKIEEIDFIIRTNSALQSKYLAGDYNECIKDYNKAIKEEEDNPEFYLGRGKCHQQSGNPKRALKDYTQAIELDINYMEAIETRAGLYLEEEDYPEAIADYSVLITNFGDDPRFYAKRAEVKNASGDLKGAIKDYNKAIAIKEDYRYYFDKGMVQVKQGNLEAAVESFQEASQLNPHFVSAHYQRGLANLEIGQVEAAGEDFSRALLIGLKTEKQNKIAAIAHDFFQRGVEAFKNEDYEAAGTQFSNAIFIDPNVKETYFNRGRTNYLLGNYEAAIEDFTTVLEFDPEDYEALYHRGLAKTGHGDYKAAIKDFTEAVNLKHDYHEAFEARGDANMKLTYYGQALDDYNKALSIDDELPTVYNKRGLVKHINQDYEAAIDDFKEAIKETEGFAEAYYNRGQSYMKLKEYKKALHDFEDAVEYDKTYSKAFHAKGEVLQIMEDYDDAIEDFTEAIAYDPEHASSYFLRGQCRVKEEDYKLALDDYLKAFMLDPELSTAQAERELGFIYLKVKKPDHAIEHLNNVLEELDNKGQTLYWLASAYLLKKDIDTALDYFEKSFKTGEVEWKAIKGDLSKKVKKNKKFKELVKAYLD